MTMNGNGTHPSNGTLLWSTTRDIGRERELLDTVGREFAMEVAVCQPAQLLAIVKAERPRLVAIELGDDPNERLTLLREVDACMQDGTVFAATGDTDVATMRLALEAGASDCLSLPLDGRELRKALLKATEAAARTPRNAAGAIITIYGVRGGLGVTTLAVNLANKMLAATGGGVGLVDLDVQRGDVTAFLNLTPLHSLASIAHATTALDDAFLATILARHTGGLYVLPAPIAIEDADALSHEDVVRMLELMRARFPYSIIDTPRTITATTVAAFETADRILLVSDLSVPSMRAARRTMDLLARLEIPTERIDLVLTKSMPGPIDAKDAARTIGKVPLAIIPRDEAAASAAMNAGLPLNGTRGSGLSLSVSQLAGELAGVESRTRSRPGRLLHRFFAKGTAHS
jgi:pilus assembly protein CpaE